MTGYQSKRTAALDEEGMYLVHQTDHQGKHMTKDKTLKLALEVNESMKDVLKQVNELIVENKALKEALAQPEQEPPTIEYQSGYYDGKKAALAGREWNFCERCGKRTADLTVIHTCTPPQENT